MLTTMGYFASAETARLAVRRLHAAGFSEDDIAFQIEEEDRDGPNSEAERTSRTGRRMAAFASDVGEAAVSFMPFIGRNLVDSPMGRALREVTEESGAAAGRLFGAVSAGGFVGPEQDRSGELLCRAIVLVRAGSRTEEARALLSESGAQRVEG